MREFKINEFITLKLIERETKIFINDQYFDQCKFLLFNILVEEITRFDEIRSIDDIADMLNWTEDGQQNVKYEIEPETEFWAHCSNMQVWVEHDYDTRLLYSNLAFPLLKKLTEIGDPVARRVFKEEIAIRLESGAKNVFWFLLEGDYLQFLTKEELTTLFTPDLIKKLLVQHRYERENVTYPLIDGLKKHIPGIIDILGGIILDPNIDIGVRTTLHNIGIFRYFSRSIRDKSIKIYTSKIKDYIFKGDIETFTKLYKYHNFKLFHLFNAEDWLDILNNPDLNLFQFLKQIEDISQEKDKLWGIEFSRKSYEFQKLFSSNLLIPFREKIIHSIKTENLEAISFFIEIYSGVFFPPLEMHELFREHFKIFLQASSMVRIDDYFTDMLKKVYYENPEKYSTQIYELLVDWSHPKGDLIKLLRNQGFFRNLEDERLEIIAKNNNDLKLFLKNLSINKFEEVEPNQALILAKIEKIMKLEMKSFIPDEHPSSINLDLRYFAESGDVKILKIAYCKLEDIHLKKIMRHLKKLNKLEILELNHNDLTIIPEEIGVLLSLKELALFYNSLTSVPDSIGNLENLEILDLSYNRLSSLPESICNLKSLKKINLYKNHQIEEFPLNIGNLKNLESLILWECKIRCLPDTITQLKSLKELNLWDNPIDRLPNNFGDLMSLEYLYICDTNIKYLPSSFKRLANIKKLYLSNKYGRDLNKLRQFLEPVINRKNLFISIYKGGFESYTIHDIYDGKFSNKSSI